MPNCMMVKDGPCSGAYGYGEGGMWNRWASPEEVEHYHETGDLPKSENTCTLAMYSCTEHLIDEERRSAVHPADCEWEQTGVCQHTMEDLTHVGIPYNPNKTQ